MRDVDYSKPSVNRAVVGIRLEGGIRDIGAAASRAIPSYARYRYAQTVTYILDDGQEIKDVIAALTKPKLASRESGIRAHIDNRCMAAHFHHARDGSGMVYTGTSTHYRIGVDGVKPVPVGQGF